jgi:hypothetical protein
MEPFFVRLSFDFGISYKKGHKKESRREHKIAKVAVKRFTRYREISCWCVSSSILQEIA